MEYKENIALISLLCSLSGVIIGVLIWWSVVVDRRRRIDREQARIAALTKDTLETRREATWLNVVGVRDEQYWRSLLRYRSFVLNSLEYSDTPDHLVAKEGEFTIKEILEDTLNENLLDIHPHDAELIASDTPYIYEQVYLGCTSRENWVMSRDGDGDGDGDKE